MVEAILRPQRRHRRQRDMLPPCTQRAGHGGGPAGRAKKGLIEQAYHEAEGAGIAVFCQDEAGPYQAIPRPGAVWRPGTKPARQPNEYVRGGRAKLLTLFRPADGVLRAKPVTSGTDAVLHPWLITELEQALAELPERETPEEERPAAARWATWLGHAPITAPPLRAILVWDNLAGDLSWSIVRWLFQHGVRPLSTPLSGSWLNRAESLQRIFRGRALAGKHPTSQEELVARLEGAVAGWSAAPTHAVRPSPVSGASAAAPRSKQNLNHMRRDPRGHDRAVPSRNPYERKRPDAGCSGQRWRRVRR
jgi:hypothetical protein